MHQKNNLEQYLCDHITFSLVGRLTSGIVHNLNGPLQILSMQIELFNREIKKEISDLHTLKKNLSNDNCQSIIDNLIDKFNKRSERIEQLETTINRMEHIVNVISKRCRTTETLSNTVFINQIIEEELVFWQGDLFFKHNVEKQINFSNNPIVIQTDETKFRLIIDLLLALLINRIKNYQKPFIKIETKTENNSVNIIMYQPAENFKTQYFDYDLLNILKEMYESQIDSDTIEEIIILHFTKYLCETVDIIFNIKDNKLILTITK